MGSRNQIFVQEYVFICFHYEYRKDLHLIFFYMCFLFKNCFTQYILWTTTYGILTIIGTEQTPRQWVMKRVYILYQFNFFIANLTYKPHGTLYILSFSKRSWIEVLNYTKYLTETVIEKYWAGIKFVWISMGK